MRASFCSHDFAHAEYTGAKDGPDLFLIENSVLLLSFIDLFLKIVVEEFVEEGYFIEGRAKGVLKFGVCSLEVEGMLVFIGETFRKVDEGLLVGLLVGEGVLF